ncbi:hypothetical protein [Sphingomonas sp.]|jgi:hypothetical protein|uniref:hypothetical protein n=1 Tax=Sphingomonas sp. TaxID=28214 RepID=UPI0026284E10|nr:hypothetical protein [Sphingomonas sp.]MDF2493390.1 hypothetical protein [Sphingomonas sp.]
MTDVATLAKAIMHLRDFRASLYDGDEVDTGSQLSGTDIDIVLAAAERQLRSDQMGGIGLEGPEGK